MTFPSFHPPCLLSHYAAATGRNNVRRVFTAEISLCYHMQSYGKSPDTDSDTRAQSFKSVSQTQKQHAAENIKTRYRGGAESGGGGGSWWNNKRKYCATAATTLWDRMPLYCVCVCVSVRVLGRSGERSPLSAQHNSSSQPGPQMSCEAVAAILPCFLHSFLTFTPFKQQEILIFTSLPRVRWEANTSLMSIPVNMTLQPPAD